MRGQKINRKFKLVFFRSKDNYEVNDAEKGGKENTAFDNESDTTKKEQSQQQQNGSTTTTANGKDGQDEKWVQNYVPFGDYPKGNIVYVKEVITKNVSHFSYFTLGQA